MLCVGNDIVDLSSEDAADKQNDIRFLKKTLSAEESEQFDQDTDKFLTLWRFWTAKETAYKIGKTLDPDLVFSPRKFRVSLDVADPGASGFVTWGQHTAQVRWTHQPGWLHCIGTNATKEFLDDCTWEVTVNDGNPHDSAPEDARFSGRERASIFSRESIAVRELAKSLLLKSGLTDVEIVRTPLGNRFGPPQIFSGGRPLSTHHLSLSHHERYVAAAFLSE